MLQKLSKELSEIPGFSSQNPQQAIRKYFRHAQIRYKYHKDGKKRA